MKWQNHDMYKYKFYNIEGAKLEDTVLNRKTEKITINYIFVIEGFIWLLFILGIIIKSAYFQFSTKINIKPYFGDFNKNMFLALIASAITICAAIILFFNKKRLVALFIADIFFTLLLLADTLYFRYYYNAITVPVLYQIGLVSSITDSAKSLFRVKDIIFAIDIPLFILFILYYKKLKPGRFIAINPLKRIISSIIILLISVGMLKFAYGQSSPGVFPYDNNYVINELGILYFHYYDIKRNIHERYFADRSLESEEKALIDNYFDSKKSEGSKLNGIAARKNLIVVQMEAIQQFVINAEFNGKEITPNLNKFINESVYLDNFYYQVGTGNTSDAELLANTSLYPLRDGSAYFKYPTNTYESLPGFLEKLGYNSYVFHANNPSFWNRTEMYKAIGFDKFISSRDFTLDERLGWGLSDESFFRQSLEEIDTTSPFYSFMITLSSHHPYNYFDDYNGFDVGKYEDTMTGNYVKAASYVDKAIGSLLEDLKKRGLYDNSIIVIYGDHHAVLKDQTEMLEELIGFEFSEYNWTLLHKTPCLIRFPGLEETGVNSTISGEIDLLPTIANLMGFKAPHALGKDIFNTENGYAVLRDGSVITDEFVYVSTENKVYNNEGIQLEIKEYREIIDKYRQELEISDIILQKDALKNYNNN